MQDIPHMFFWHNKQIICASIKWKLVPLICPTPPVIMWPCLVREIGNMFLQDIQPCLQYVVYYMASIAKPIPLKAGVESLGNVAPTIGDNSRAVHIHIEQMELLHSKPSNDCTYTTLQQLGNVLRRGEIYPVIEACRENSHLDGQLSHLTSDTIPAPDAPTPNGGRGDYPQFQSNGLS